MKALVVAIILLALSRASAGDASLESLPKPEEVFTIACEPGSKQLAAYFSAASLLKALPEFRKGKAEIKSGAKRVWQSGVIVLKDKRVLFWSTCRTNFIHIHTADDTVSFIRDDGKDNL